MLFRSTTASKIREALNTAKLYKAKKEAAGDITGKEIPAEKADRRPGDPDTLIASSEKARTVLGWKPQFDNIEKIIASAWAWHSSHPKGYDDRG